jgi:hypothetical protein
MEEERARRANHPQADAAAPPADDAAASVTNTAAGQQTAASETETEEAAEEADDRASGGDSDAEPSSADDEESPATDLSAGPELAGPGQRSAGPPPDWVEKVQRGAPQLLRAGPPMRSVPPDIRTRATRLPQAGPRYDDASGAGGARSRAASLTISGELPAARAPDLETRDEPIADPGTSAPVHYPDETAPRRPAATQFSGTEPPKPVPAERWPESVGGSSGIPTVRWPEEATRARPTEFMDPGPGVEPETWQTARAVDKFAVGDAAPPPAPRQRALPQPPPGGRRLRGPVPPSVGDGRRRAAGGDKTAAEPGSDGDARPSLRRPTEIRPQVVDLESSRQWQRHLVEYPSPWPSLPDDHAGEAAVEIATALRQRDRWLRLMREQENA